MSRHPFIAMLLAILGLTLAIPAQAAEEHRATHLGNPATRFAPPLRTPEDLRARFRDPKLRPDIAAILRQWGWRGNLNDLYRAAERERISPVQLPYGTRLPFMSSRENGKPITLRNVVWVGKQPIDAYAFVFTSNGRRYRCVTPKACSNFLLIDLGEDRPNLQVEYRLPPRAHRCDPVESRILVRNAGHSILTRVQIDETLADCLTTPDGKPSWQVEIPSLRPGEVRELRHPLKPTKAGNCEGTVQVTSAEGAKDSARARIDIRAPEITLDCRTPTQVFIGRPIEVCLTVRNTGSSPASNVVVNLPLPSGATATTFTEAASANATPQGIFWTTPRLDAGQSRTFCATLASPNLGPVPIVAGASADCADPVQSTCASAIAGVPGILLEVIDLEDPVEVGKEVTYVIRILNQGSARLTQVRTAGTLPELQDYVSATGATPVVAEDAALRFEPVAVLEPGAEATWRVVTRARESGNALFRIEVVSDQLTRTVSETETTNHY